MVAHANTTAHRFDRASADADYPTEPDFEEQLNNDRGLKVVTVY